MKLLKTIGWFILFKIQEFFQGIWWLIKTIPYLVIGFFIAVGGFSTFVLLFAIAGIPGYILLKFFNIPFGKPDPIIIEIFGEFNSLPGIGAITLIIVLMLLAFYMIFWNPIKGFIIDNWEKAKEKVK